MDQITHNVRGAQWLEIVTQDEIEKELVEIKWDAEAAEKSGYEHFLMKEIHEQPRVISDTLHSVYKDGTFDLFSVGLSDE